MENKKWSRKTLYYIIMTLVCIIWGLLFVVLHLTTHNLNTQTENNINQPERTCLTETEVKQYNTNGSLVKTIISEKCTWVGYYG